MKKILLLFLIGLFSFQIVLADAMELRAGFMADGESDETDGSKEFGYGAKAEVMKDLGFLSEVGIGIGYQVFGEAIEYWGGNLTNDLEEPAFSAVPLYGVVKIKLGSNEMFLPYIRANLGYSFPSETENEDDFENLSVDGGGTEDLEITQSGGAYYGIGAGLVLGGFIIELLYEVNKIDYEIENTTTSETREYDNEFSRITLEFGYRAFLDGGFGSAVSFEPASSDF